MADITFQVQPRGRPIKRLPKEITLPSTASTADIYNHLSSKTGLSIHRLRITNDSSVLAASNPVSLATASLNDGTVLSVKDLGPQIAWRTVFVIEYLGPLLIHPILYFARAHLYGNPNGPGTQLDFPAPSSAQTLALVLSTIHFAKRELETLFLHRFSSATMPAFNIVKNSAHYWALAGANIAYWVYSPTSPTASLTSDSLIVKVGLALFVIGELGNLYTHYVLANLRPAGTTTRAIPRGFGFGLVTCPNYTFEVLAWVGMCLVTLSWSTVLFTAVAGGQMLVWAQKKERRYRKEFQDKYKKKRATMIPFVA
ncbi:hypothetical protein BT63DRAFT_443907 [Microthyrium microscopicum]|uniref:very-long-chain enoyl-CoA reductase n=1 Tax=Microthyrium microscopicum TaxID=703497 RepID=A0A6A6TYP1_9PEZI|nr:hypothetical protein BT63DRAFT_443907 [Microthyrium microscopicum]